MYFVLYSFWTIFLVLNIVVSIFYITYKSYYAEIVRNIPDPHIYSRIIAASIDQKRQLVVLDAVEELTREYLKEGIEKLDLILASHLQRQHEKTVLDSIPQFGEEEPRDTGCRRLLPKTT